MAVTGLLALLDDVSTILDDVAAVSKLAAEKTAGIAGDDLAVNAEGLVGLAPAREVPIVLKVALGSFVNKLVLIPLALALPRAAITPLLMIGGAFLCYEGVHKVMHKLAKKPSRDDDEHKRQLLDAVRAGPEALKQVEAAKVRQAIVTDIVLSAEIIAVALGAVAAEPFAVRATVLVVVGVGMTVAIYGLVAGIVKLDDLGLHLMTKGGEGGSRRRLGKLIVDKTPLLMKGISVVGTLAMFLVGGGIVLHGVPGAEAAVHHAVERVAHGGALASVLGAALSLLAGVVVGLVALPVGGAVAKGVALARRRASP